MNGKLWRKAGAATALSMALAAPADAFLLFGGEPANVEPAIEYHNASLGEYLVTVSADEIAALDAGAAPGWVRTRLAFYTVDGPASARVVGVNRLAASPVCRVFMPPASHFLSASRDECADVARIPGAVLETEAAFYAWAPDDEGRCPRLFARIGGFSFAPVYRLGDSRHGNMYRLTASKPERDAMVTDGWVPEGSGAEGVAMCVPSWSGG